MAKLINQQPVEVIGTVHYHMASNLRQTDKAKHISQAASAAARNVAKHRSNYEY